MTGYILRRFGQFIPVLFIASIAIWAIIYAAPGSPADAYAGVGATPVQVAEVSKDLGLDRPIYVQYLHWLGHALTGDLGKSAVTGMPVIEPLQTRIPATIWLGVASMLIGLLIGIPLGALQAIRPRSKTARSVTYFQSIGLALPTFWVGLLLILGFVIGLPAFPVPAQYLPPWSHPIESVRNIALPALTIGILVAAIISRFFSAALRDAMQSDFIRMARSKGASERRVVLRHGAANAMLPTVTVAGLQIGSLFGGAVVTEVVFNYPGLGRLLFNAVLARDYPLIQGGVMFIVIVFLILNLAIDLLYARLDPRVRLERD